MKQKIRLVLMNLYLKHCKDIPHAYPGLKGALVLELSKTTKATQVDVAKKLGITQASVSFYLSRFRGRSSPLVRSNKKIKAAIKKIARSIVC